VTPTLGTHDLGSHPDAVDDLAEHVTSTGYR